MKKLIKLLFSTAVIMYTFPVYAWDTYSKPVNFSGGGTATIAFINNTQANVQAFDGNIIMYNKPCPVYTLNWVDDNNVFTFSLNGTKVLTATMKSDGTSQYLDVSYFNGYLCDWMINTNASVILGRYDKINGSTKPLPLFKK